MAIERLTQASILTLTKYANMMAGSFVIPPGMELINTQVLSSPAASVTFSSIPQTYKHLQIRMLDSDSNAGATMDSGGYFTANGDTTMTNYSYHFVDNNGSGMNAGYSNSAVGGLRGVATSLNTPSSYSAHIAEIADYSLATKNKVIRTIGGHVNSTYNAFSGISTSTMWMNTAAMTSLTINAPGANLWNVNSRFSLYGWN